MVPGTGYLNTVQMLIACVLCFKAVGFACGLGGGVGLEGSGYP